MRLLNTSSLKLEEFLDDREQTYAILSHRWQDDEVSLQDMQRGTAKERAGFAKIKKCCELAKENGLKYAWVDTCCIDKSSSAELSEAINSMYRWYQNASVCYAYLFDVRQLQGAWEWDVQKSDFRENFLGSTWWARGWTLQELIAPSKVVFYNSVWQELGTKSTLKTEIVSVTGIDVTMLEGSSPENFSIAKRMSWAAKRTTTRVEDMAYSLLGLFSVNMPMLYGEGDRAFVRLQEEIMKQSDDHSLFAWSSMEEHSRGLLAKSPADFQGCRNIVSSEPKWNRVPYLNTNLGLSIELPVVAWAMDTYLAAIDCQVEHIPDSRIGIFLRLLPGSNEQCVRVSLDGKDTETFNRTLISQSQYRKIYVRQKYWGSSSPIDKMYGFWIRKMPVNVPNSTGWGGDYILDEVYSWNKWDSEKRMLKMPNGSHGTAGIIWYQSGVAWSFLRLGFDITFNPVCEFGGPFWGPDSRLYHMDDRRAPLHEKLDNEWITKPSHANAWFYKGDRLTGLSQAKNMFRITMTQDVIDGQRMWVVNVERLDKPYRAPTPESYSNTICDGCNEKIFGLRFQCQTCEDFDFCLKCLDDPARKHPDHKFQPLRSDGDKIHENLIENQPSRRSAITNTSEGNNEKRYKTSDAWMDADDDAYSMNSLFEE